ncbi:hypothetical protein [Sphingomonas sp.]|jgi:hypothetical protein|uniref:hypothetical protein n=1 Tax=Sphingomonas sp. TaxID=28214 RepID=UPI002ED98057
MSLILFALVAAWPAQQLSDGDTIVALAWERRRKDVADPAVQCIELDGPSMADRIRLPDHMMQVVIGKDTSQQLNRVRLRRIAKGEGQTLAFDIKRLGLPGPSPACKYRYSVNAPVQIDGGIAYVHVGMHCGSFCGGGEILVMERREGTWRILEELLSWAT